MNDIRKKNLKLSLLLSSSFLLLAGCQVVSVKQQSLDVSLANDRNSILTQNRLSEASLNTLATSGQDAKNCTLQPDQCIGTLKDITEIGDEQFLSAASEVYLAKAMQLENSSSCKRALSSKQPSSDQQSCQEQMSAMLDKSIRYSYAYLFKSQRAPDERIFDNRQVQIRDFYNQAVAKLLTTWANVYRLKEEINDIQVGQSTYRFDLSQFALLKESSFERFISTYDLRFSGLRSINRRDGFGSEFVSVLKDDQADKKNTYNIDPLNHPDKNGGPNIHKARYLPTTIVVRPKDEQSVNAILNSKEIIVQAYDPFFVKDVNVAGKSYPLAANFSAPYGLWLAENNLGAAAFLTLIDREERLSMPHLFQLEPYNPTKKVIVLVHGLASSPEAWIALTNDIMGDSVLRDHYQVWQIFYSTNMPILESRYQIYALLKQAFSKLDPNDPAAQNTVLIGHSMGGIISRLLVSHDDISNAAFKAMTPRQRQQYQNSDIVHDRLEFIPFNNIDRAVFMSSPHRGTDYADRWFTLAARRIIKLPGAFLGAVGDTMSNNDADMKSFLLRVDEGLIQNGPSDLSYKSNFIKLTKHVMPPQNFTFHSIIGNKTNSNDPDKITDGIVPYKSAHLDGAKSEIIIHGGHSIQETPEAVLELRRILREHLKDHQLD